jgi:glycosyltransferase involved in cell wall biosynthesis
VVWEINAPLDELSVVPRAGVLPAALLRWLRARVAPRVAAALCVSAPLLRHARDLGIHRAVLCENGSDPDHFRPERSDPACLPELRGRFRVLWAGSPDYPWHDFDILFRAAALLRDAADVAFIVLGGRPAMAAPAPDSVVFLPPRPYAQVPAIFASAHVGLCLYRPVPWSRYGWYFSPLKLFDYAASGLPVLYSQVPELHTMAGDLGLPVPVGDATALFRQVLRLRDDPDLRARLAAQARQAVLRHYNWDRVAAQVESLLLEVCRR